MQKRGSDCGLNVPSGDLIDLSPGSSSSCAHSQDAAPDLLEDMLEADVVESVGGRSEAQAAQVEKSEQLGGKEVSGSSDKVLVEVAGCDPEETTGPVVADPFVEPKESTRSSGISL